MTELSLKPLKTPTQKRSWLTFNAILEATTYILIEDGYADLTTNRVAERAGVSIASLYQYFPNKESLVATLHVEHAKITRNHVKKALSNQENASITILVDRFVEAMIEAHIVNPELHRVFQEEIPRLLKTAILEEGNDEFLATIGLLTEKANLPAITKDDLTWTIRIMTHSIIHHAIIERPQDLQTGQLGNELKVILYKLLG